MSVFKTYEVSIDTMKSKKNEPIVFNQMDHNTAKLIIHVLHDGEVLDLTEREVRIALFKPDATRIYQECTIVDAANGVVEVLLTTQTLAVPGNVKAELTVVLGTDTTITTTQFAFSVKKSIMSDDSIESVNELPIIQKAIDAGEILADVDLQTIVNNTENVNNLREEIETAQGGHTSLDSRLVDNEEEVFHLKSEVETARGGQVSLSERFNSVAVQLAQTAKQSDLDTVNQTVQTLDVEKADKTHVWNMSNMGQDIKESMTGGSVAVVGVDAVLEENIVDGQVTPRKMSNYDITWSRNLFDKTKAVDGVFANYTTGIYTNYATSASSGKLEVEPSKTYVLSMPSTQKGFEDVVRCWDANLAFLGNSKVVSTNPVASGITVVSNRGVNGKHFLVITLTADTLIRYIETTIILNYETHDTTYFNNLVSSIQFEVGGTPTEYVEYGYDANLKDENAPKSYTQVLGDLDIIKQSSTKQMKILKIGDDVYLRTKWDNSSDLIEHIQLKNTDENKAFEFNKYYLIPNTTLDSEINIVGTIVKYTHDDITPANYNYTYIGANHGAYFVHEIVMTAHGKTNQDVGSEWLDASNRKFYIIKIVDANTLWALSENIAVDGTWRFYEVISSPLAHSQGAINTATVNFTSSSLKQLKPAIKNQVKKLLLDGKTEITDDGIYTCEHFDVVNSYDITNVKDLLDKLIAGRGTNTPISFNASSVGNDARFIITYKFHKNGSCTVFHSLKAINKVKLDYIGFMQSIANSVPGGGKLYQYVPKITPITVNGTVYDFKSIQDITNLSNSVNLLSSYWEDINNPPDRFLQVGKTSGGLPYQNFGFIMGYCLERGIGKPSVRKANITNAGNIFTTKKQYPHAIDNRYLNAGEYFDCVAFRCPVNYNYDSQATNVSWYYVNNDVYLMLDYHVDVNKALELPTDFIGKNVTVVEKTDSFTINSEFVTADGINISVTGGYGYAVLKLS